VPAAAGTQLQHHLPSVHKPFCFPNSNDFPRTIDVPS
jgi:hypothetical protein